jgi:tRNA pseudouridine38-40 synthase
MPRIAMKIAYRGSDFHGQARQPGLRTVEGEVLHALVRTGAIRDPKTSRFQSASRTDRGVSALGNVVAFDTRFPPEPAVRGFNGKARGVWAWAAVEVPEDFSARRARERWYRYLLPPEHDAERIDAALRRFEGEHDFRNFTRDRARTVARIDSARAIPGVGGITLDFRAPSFRWNLVRRLVSAALRVEAGKASIADLDTALDGPGSLDLGLAPPEPLVLMDVLYTFDIPRVRDPTTRARVRDLLAERDRDAKILEEIARKFEVL